MTNKPPDKPNTSARPTVSIERPKALTDPNVKLSLQKSIGNFPENFRVILEVVKGPQCGQRYELHKIRTTFGRGDADIDLQDSQTTRKHLSIKVCDDKDIILRDLLSTNGTLVNQERVLQTQLNDGDEITLGGTELKIQVRDCS